MRARGRVDTNHVALIHALRSAPGVSVFDLSAMGHGCSDIVVGWRGQNWLFEIKAPKKRRNLSPAQRRFRDGWTGQYAVVETADEALGLMGYLTRGEHPAG